MTKDALSFAQKSKQLWNTCFSAISPAHRYPIGSKLYVKIHRDCENGLPALSM